MANRKRPKAALSDVTVDVDVTPVSKSGDVVFCDLEPSPGGGGGAHVKDGVIFLADGNNYVMNFHLKNGSMGQFAWDADPFWAKMAKCPTSSGMPNAQFPKQPTVAGDVLTVSANGVRGKSAVHFRLNMKDPQQKSVFCDPIIINN